MGTIVQKYGGTSVDGREKIMAIARSVAELRREGHDVVVVVSAPGLMTDRLLSDARSLTHSPSQRELDMLMTAGERISMSLLSIALNSVGCPAVSFTGSQVGIITDTRHTDARILEVRPFRVVEQLEAGKVVVVGGFQGVSTAKDVTTLGRGGSDTTAVVLAAALGADRCEILTDVDGVYTADPVLVSGATRVGEISYEDMHELARLGATVLKEDAVRFAERHGITLHVRASCSAAPGTIVLREPLDTCRPVVGLTLYERAALAAWTAGGFPELAGTLGELKDRAIFVVSGVGRTLAALDGRAGEATQQLSGRGATVREAALLSAVGPNAGGAETAAAALAAIHGAGKKPLAACASGRSTVVAVERDQARDLLETLHALFFA
jgi:aspartate kinase